MHLNTVYTQTASSSHISMRLTCVSSQTFAGVTSRPAFAHLHFQVGTSEEISFPRVIHVLSPHDSKVAEAPPLQTQPPAGKGGLKVDLSTERCINETAPPQPRCLCSPMPILETNQIALTIAFLSSMKYFRKSPRRSPYKHTTRRLNRPLSRT